MKVKSIKTLLMISGLLIIGVFIGYKILTSETVKSRISNVNNIEYVMNQEGAISTYNKYYTKVVEEFDGKGLQINELYSNPNDSSLVSKLYYESDNLNSGLSKFWYGLSFTEDNLIEKLSLSLDYMMKSDDLNINVSESMVGNILRIFFKYTSCVKDVQSNIDRLIAEKSSEEIELNYDKGLVKLKIVDNKISVVVDLNV